MAYSALWAWEFYQFNTYEHQKEGPNSFAIEAGFNTELIQELSNLNLSLGLPPPPLQSLNAMISWPWPELSLSSPQFQQARFIHVLASDAHALQIEAFINGTSLGSVSSFPYRFSISAEQIGTNNKLQVKIKNHRNEVIELNQVNP